MIALYWQLVVSFLSVGLSAYGGGIATIALIHHEVVATQGWLTGREFTDIVTIAQMTPGPIAVNTATFVGFQLVGVPGALIATAAVIAPAVVLLTVIVLIARRVRTQVPVENTVKPAVLALIVLAVSSFAEGAIDGVLTGAIAVVAMTLFLTVGERVHPVLIVVAGGVAGVLLL
ncbi:MAG: chromate transporter [Spirochaetales bacterium]